MGSRRLGLRAFVSPSHSPSYIYQIVPTDKSLAILTSSDEILLVDPGTLQNRATLAGVPQDVTCLVATEQDGRSVACSSRDGSIVFFDVRTQKQIRRINIEGGKAITALACDTKTGRTAAGTELSQSQSVINLWDHRSSKLLWQSRESHNDDLTQLQFHPWRANYLLSGATDGLVNIFDVNVLDEDEALIQVVNHSSIHKAGFLTENDIFALSHDEKLSIHPLHTVDEDSTEPDPIHLGDLRPRLGCEYAIDILPLAQGVFLATGNHTTAQDVKLTPLAPNSTWSLLPSAGLEMEGAHGEEIVRSIYVDEQSETVFTGGEDGLVKVWDALDGDKTNGVLTRPNTGAKKATSHRYKPY